MPEEEVKKSTHKVEVIKIEHIEPCPNADKLDLVKVWGYQCLVRKGDFKVGDLGAYIVPDSNCDAKRPEFSFLLDKNHPDKTDIRIRVRKLRGIVSQGLLIKAPDGAKEGDDIAELLGVTRWEPKVSLTMGHKQSVPGPATILAPKYDVEDWHRYREAFVSGEEVVGTEKIHGCLAFGTLVRMADGKNKMINELQAGEYVLGMTKEGDVVPARVQQVFNNGQNLEGWLRIMVTNTGGNRGNSYHAVFCTPNHQFARPDGSYTPAMRLSIGDEVLTYRGDVSLTPIQKQILVGKIIGDGSIRVVVNGTAAVTWGHTVEKSEYNDFVLNSIGGVADRTRILTSGYGTKIDCCSTLCSHTILKELATTYLAPDGTKQIHSTEQLLQDAGPITLAIWYMDDGSLAHDSGQEDRALFAVCNFDEPSCRSLQQLLLRFGIQSAFYGEEKRHRLRLNADDAEKLFLLIAPYIPPCMQYKLPERYRGGPGWLPRAGRMYKPLVLNQRVIGISPSDKQSLRYDIETETHNYFASSILVHNCNARFVFDGEKLHVGSHNQWILEDPLNLWWKATLVYRGIVDFCVAHPNIVLYGELYGMQNLKYGIKQGEFRLAVFDLYAGVKGAFLAHDEARKLTDGFCLDWVPILYRGPYDEAAMKALSNGPSTMPSADHIREGVVVKPVTERWEKAIGRVQLKIVSDDYLATK